MTAEAPPLTRDRAVQGWIVVGALSNVGDVVWSVALAWTAVHLASAAMAGVVVAAGRIPLAVMLLVGGAIADRVDARRLMALTDVLRALTLVATAAIGWTAGPSLPLLLVVAVLFGVGDAFYGPAAAVYPRQLVHVEDLPRYAAASQTAMRLGTMAGGVLGGILVALWGLAGSAVVDAASFVVLLLYLVALLAPRFPVARAPREPMLRGIAAGFAHLRAEPTTRTLVLTLSGLNLAVTPALSLGVALRVADRGWGAHLVGISDALVGLGAVVGALATMRRKPRRIAVGGFGLLVLQGLGIVVMGLGGRALLEAACLVIGVTAGGASALLGGVFMAVVDEAYLGRMSSINGLGDNVLMPVASALFGALAAATDTAVPFVVYGAVMALLMLLVLRRPAIRRLRL